MQKLIDQFGREIDYLRISITDRCNLRCRYCMPAEGIKTKDHSEILSFEEIIKIVKIGIKMGIKKVRLTGGEPLIRKDIEILVSKLSSLGLEDISMTSNGVLLAAKADLLKKAGLNRVNISLDTLDREKFKKITRRDFLSEVLAGIKAAEAAGLKPVKINIVVMKGINDDELLDFVDLSIKEELHLRFIEYMPLGGEAEAEKFISCSEIKALIKEKFKLIPASISGNGPANYFKIKGAAGSIGFISALSQHFCGSCNRLRLTADAKFKPCLAGNQEVKIKGMSSQKIESAYLKAIELKPACHHLDFKNQNYLRKMSEIGG